MLRNSKGFTLIELLIVLVILVILAIVAIPRYEKMRDAAREENVKANMQTLQLAVEDFAVQHDMTYPMPGDSSEVIRFMRGRKLPMNPFTGRPVQIIWTGSAMTRGNLGYHISGQKYVITGCGSWSQLLNLQLKNY
jgi:prepilin-type N-terminal cleavage/methylation domain-containing protein